MVTRGQNKLYEAVTRRFLRTGWALMSLTRNEVEYHRAPGEVATVPRELTRAQARKFCKLAASNTN
jgi:hypothetical protein